MEYFYEKAEVEILNEKPYNWKKHFIFQIPEMLNFFIKVIFLYLVFQIFVASVMVSAVATALSFSKDKIIEKAEITNIATTTLNQLK